MSTNEIIEGTPVFKDGPEMDAIIKVVGVGGGGNNAINHMFDQKVQNVSFAVINTDRQALLNSSVPTKLLIGPETTKGLGAGNNPEVARKAAEESASDIDKLFDDNTSMVFITAGMGGGTGTGAAPVVARIAHERGLLTVGIVTIPFLFEGEKKILKALDGADEMAKYVDALLVINNERLTEIYKDLTFMNGFGKADDTLSTAATSISEIITREGYINLDFKDVETTLREGGSAIISSGYSNGQFRVREAIEDALNSPLLKNRNILGSKRLLFNLYVAAENENRPFLMEETNQLTDFISQINPEVDVIWGVTVDNSLGDNVKITILAAGFDDTVREESESLRNEHRARASQRKSAAAATKQPEAAPAPQPAAQKQKEDDAETNRKRIEIHYSPEKVKQMGNNYDRATNRVLSVEQLDDDNSIEDIAATPAYGRSKALNSNASVAPRRENDNRRRTDF